jgi:hypothetical protein
MQKIRTNKNKLGLNWKSNQTQLAYGKTLQDTLGQSNVRDNDQAYVTSQNDLLRDNIRCNGLICNLWNTSIITCHLIKILTQYLKCLLGLKHHIYFFYEVTYYY